MVVWLTAFALSQENYAIRFGMLAQTLLPTWDLPVAKGAASQPDGERAGWMERLWHRKPAGRMAAHLKTVGAVHMHGPPDTPKPSCFLGSFTSSCFSSWHISVITPSPSNYGVWSAYPSAYLDIAVALLGYLKGHEWKKPPIPLAEILSSDSNQNNIGILPKQVLSNQILTGSVTDSLQLERQRAVLHLQPVRPVLSVAWASRQAESLFSGT